MSEKSTERTSRHAAEIEVKRRKGPSIIWAVPVVALIAAGWLIFTAMAEQGPIITISFATAEGLEADKTKIKYRDIDIGSVTDIIFSDDLSQVIVTAELRKEVEEHLTQGSRFWVVRPRLTSSGVSGLGTLISGAYIELDPVPGEPTKEFVGLEEPPPIRASEEGRRFLLRSNSLGSISKGSPILFRGIQVGEVLDHHLADDNSHVAIEIFVRGAQADMIRPKTRFWNASGVSAKLGADGAEVSVESMQALFAGGIAFQTEDDALGDEPSEAGSVFPLFANFDQQDAERFTQQAPLVAYFDGSLRGLSVGAPVEYRGIRVGTVTDIDLNFDTDSLLPSIPVTFVVESGRVRQITVDNPQRNYDEFAILVERGLRAQLDMGNLLTGQLVVSLAMFPDAPHAELERDGPIPVIPTAPTDLEKIGQSVTTALNKVANLPLEEIVEETRRGLEALADILTMPEIPQAIRSADAAIGSANSLMGSVEADVGPLISSLRRTADQANVAIARAVEVAADAGGIVGEESQTRYNLDATLSELASAARSIRLLADYLEQYPEALVRGKAGG